MIATFCQDHKGIKLFGQNLNLLKDGKISKLLNILIEKLITEFV